MFRPFLFSLYPAWKTDEIWKLFCFLLCRLANNPICDGIQGTESYCGVQKTNSSYITLANNCTPTVCQSGEILSPLCRCAIPYTGTLHFIYFSFSNYNSSYFSYLPGFLMIAFQENLLPVDSILLSNPTFDTYFFRQFTLNIFPSGQDYFNRTGISAIGTLLNRQPQQVISYFGPFYFTDESYPLFGGNYSFLLKWVQLCIFLCVFCTSEAAAWGGGS